MKHVSDTWKHKALEHLRAARFREYEDALREYEECGGAEDIDVWACNIVSGEIERGLYR